MEADGITTTEQTERAQRELKGLGHGRNAETRVWCGQESASLQDLNLLFLKKKKSSNFLTFWEF